jgi:hypothetical protein
VMNIAVVEATAISRAPTIVMFIVKSDVILIGAPYLLAMLLPIRRGPR